MVRTFRLILGLLVVLSIAGEARAQFGNGYYPGGYGGYGWGGWGATPQGDMARGLGMYAMGAGQYNLNTAQARSINTDTAMRWNEYVYQSRLVAAQNEHLRLAAKEKRDASSGEYIYQRLRDQPTASDIASGNALDVLLDQVSDPRIHSSAVRLATDRIPATLIRQIPFVNSSEAVTICLDRLIAADGWPSALGGQEYAADREAYTEAIKKALAEDREGDISPATVEAVRNALTRVRARFRARPPADNSQRVEADNYLRTLVGMTRMLARPDIEKVLAELDTNKETSLGHLLGFMQTFNLRFGPATSPEQRAAYTSLYPILATHRDRVLKAVDGKSTARASTPAPTEFLSKMKMEELEGNSTPTPTPPEPNR